MNKVLFTNGTGNFVEKDYQLPELSDSDISVKSIMTGICRSDIDMMQGNFGPLPLHMQGHEGLGQVIAIGQNVEDVQIGDYVATRGEPAYADQYHVKENQYVKVPAAEPKYIIEPVACGINIVEQAYHEILKRSGPNSKLLILGSGFLAWVAYNTILLNHLQFDIDIVGSSNTDIWNTKTKLQKEPNGSYDVVIDLSSSNLVFDKWILKDQSLIILGAQKTVTTDFQNLLWKACTIIFPSPRNQNFYSCMQDAVEWIKSGKLAVDKFWTKGYNRQTEWQQAFNDSLNRSANYSRGYLYWNQYGN